MSANRECSRRCCWVVCVQYVKIREKLEEHFGHQEFLVTAIISVSRYLRKRPGFQQNVVIFWEKLCLSMLKTMLNSNHFQIHFGEVVAELVADEVDYWTSAKKRLVTAPLRTPNTTSPQIKKNPLTATMNVSLPRLTLKFQSVRSKKQFYDKIARFPI